MLALLIILLNRLNLFLSLGNILYAHKYYLLSCLNLILLPATWTQDQSQSTYSPQFCPSSPSSAPTAEICSSMQGQPHFCASSPSPAPSNTAASAMPPSASPTSSPPLELCSKDAADLGYPDAGSYLMRPEIIVLIASGSKEPKPQTTVLKSQATIYYYFIRRAKYGGYYPGLRSRVISAWASGVTQKLAIRQLQVRRDGKRRRLPRKGFQKRQSGSSKQCRR